MATFPDHLIDVKRAIAWVREHADEHGIDPDFIVVTGASAGGHLTALTALTANDPQYQPGFEEADTSVQAAVPFYGVYDFTNRNGAWPEEVVPLFLAPVVMKCDPDEAPERYEAASPLDQVHDGAPPFFVIHGDIDILAPVEDARDFVHRLREVSNQPVYYLELKGAQHAFETFASIRANAVVEAAERFLEAVYSAHHRGGTRTPTASEVDEAMADRVGEQATAIVRRPCTTATQNVSILLMWRAPRCRSSIDENADARRGRLGVGEVAPMSLDETRKTDQDPEDDLKQRVLLHWRVRCGARRAAVEATSGPDAMALCAAVAWTLEHGTPAPDLAAAAHAWGASVSSPAEARSALLCLGEVATEISGDMADELPPTGLDPVLEQLASEAAAASARRTEPAGIDPLTGCGDRRALEGDLDEAVAGALAAGLDVAVAVVEIDGPHRERSKRLGKSTSVLGDVTVLGLVATLRRALGRADGIYRVGQRKLAVLAPGRAGRGMGELMLLATCAPGPNFSWGAADLSAGGAQAAKNPDLLLLLAEADLLLRRQDLSRANATLTRRRRMSALATAAAVALVAGGITFGLDTTAAGPGGQSHLALPGHAGDTPPIRAPGQPGRSGPVSVALSAPPSPGAGSTSTPVPDARSAVVSPPVPDARSVVVSPPAATVSLVVDQALPPSPHVAPVSPVPTTPPAGTTAAAPGGHAASAPGHVKGSVPGHGRGRTGSTNGT